MHGQFVCFSSGNFCLSILLSFYQEGFAVSANDQLSEAVVKYITTMVSHLSRSKTDTKYAYIAQGAGNTDLNTKTKPFIKSMSGLFFAAQQAIVWQLTT